MKTNKTKIKNGMFIGAALMIILALLILGLLKAINYVSVIGAKAQEYVLYPATMNKIPEINVKRRDGANRAIKGGYKYNEQAPKEVIVEEMNNLGRTFNFNKETMDRWFSAIQCESGFNNLADNSKSTALGIAQYTAPTWEETESFKQFKIARTDYKAALWEMALDIANGETWRWKDCW